MTSKKKQAPEPEGYGPVGQLASIEDSGERAMIQETAELMNAKVGLRRGRPGRQDPEDVFNGLEVDGYIRVSSEDQSDGFGPVEQREILEETAERLGARLGQVFEDAQSGTSTYGREGFNAMMVKIRAGRTKGVLMPRVDRQGRNEGDFWNTSNEVVSMRIPLFWCEEEILATYEDDEWRTRASREATEAGNYSRRLSGRVARALRSKREEVKGPTAGHPGIGFRWEGGRRSKKWVHDTTWDPKTYPPREGGYPEYGAGGAAGLRLRMLELYASGKYSLSKVARHLSELGYVRPLRKRREYKDGQWVTTIEGGDALRYSTVQSIVKSSANVGTLHYQRTIKKDGRRVPVGDVTIYKDAMPRFISDEMQAKIDRLLAKNQLAHSASNFNESEGAVSPYRDVVKHDVCGEGFWVFTNDNSRGGKYPNRGGRSTGLVHSNRGCGKSGGKFAESELDPGVGHLFKHLHFTPDILARAQKAVEAQSGAPVRVVSSRKKTLAAFEALKDMYGRGDMPKEEYRRKSDLLKKKLSDEEITPLAGPSPEELSQMCEASLIWERNDPVERKIIMNLLFDRVIVGFEPRREGGQRRRVVIREFVPKPHFQAFLAQALLATSQGDCCATRDEVVEHVEQLLRSGKTPKAIALELSVSVGHVYSLVKRHGLSALLPVFNLSAENVELRNKVEAKLREGKTVKDIALELELPSKNVYKLVKRCHLGALLPGHRKATKQTAMAAAQGAAIEESVSLRTGGETVKPGLHLLTTPTVKTTANIAKHSAIWPFPFTVRGAEAAMRSPRRGAGRSRDLALAA